LDMLAATAFARHTTKTHSLPGAQNCWEGVPPKYLVMRKPFRNHLPIRNHFRMRHPYCP
jgi:hypothetical protein